ncbi:MAG: HAD-IA family hydrolase [Nitriliruptoraceae bacterium]
MIAAIAFDVMDTLLSDPFRAALHAATGLSLEQLSARRDPTVHPAFERGELDEEAYWRAFDAAGVVADRGAFHQARRDGTRWLPGMRELLDELDGRVLRVAATNYPVWIEELAAGPLAGRLELLVASCHLGVRKPDPAFYRGLLAQLELPPQRVLFVDDRPPNVAAARELGLLAHRFTDAATLRALLGDHGVLPRRSDRR